jgi:putative inorganic carbon (HCO3(-)) transporter
MNGARSLATTTAAAPRPARWGAAPAVAIGVLCGIGCVLVAGLELRWVVYGVLVLFALTVVALWPAKERLLVTATVLGLQADVALRFFVGQAGSGGLALPLAVFPATALVVWWWTAAPPHRRLRLAGRLGVPIAAVLVTSIASVCASAERFVGTTELLLAVELYLVYVVALNAVRSVDDLEWITTLLGVSVVVQALVVLVQSALGVSITLVGDVTAIDDGLPFSGGTVGHNPAHLAAFLMPPLLIALAQLFSARRVRPRTLLVVALGMVAEALTLKRAAWAGVAIGIGWLVILGKRQRTLRRGRVVALAIVLAVLGVGVWGMMAVRLERFPIAAAYEERAGLMRMALDAIAEHPFLGIGLGAYAQSFKQFRAMATSGQWLAIVHNQYLMRGAETGIPGLAAFVLLLAAALRQALRLARSADARLRTFGCGWSAAIVVLAWHMWWEAWQSFPEVSMLWLLLGAAEASETVERAT